MDDEELQKAANHEAQKFVRRPRTGRILTPKRHTQTLLLSQSKMGGDPYPGSLKQWPECSFCKVPLNFVLQIHKRRFPQLWFPRNRNLFQIFRCPNSRCEKNEVDGDWNRDDRTMLTIYCQTRPGRISRLKYPRTKLKDLFAFPELPFKPSKFVTKKIDDYPLADDACRWWGKSWSQFYNKYAPPLVTLQDFSRPHWFWSAEFWDLIQNKEGIKIGGFPSWQQGGVPPKCSCGRTKGFIFQLASFRNRIGEICIGDAGSIYYFACRRCGEKSLQTTWDCG